MKNNFDELTPKQQAYWYLAMATDELATWFEQNYDAFVECIETLDDVRGFLSISDRYHPMSELPEDAVIDEWDCFDEDTEEHLDFDKSKKYYREVRDEYAVKYYISGDSKCVYLTYNNAYTFDHMLMDRSDIPVIDKTPELKRLFDAYEDATKMTLKYE